MVMAKLTTRSLRARWIRFLLTTIAVVLGVAFVVGSFVLADTLRKTFDTLAGSATQSTDVLVRAVDPLGGSDPNNAARPPLPASLVDDLAKVDGVADARGDITGFVSATAPSGERFNPGGAPVLGFSWSGPSENGPFSLEEGVAASGPGQVVIDTAAAETYDISLGDAVSVRAPGGEGDFTVVGIVTFADGGAGAYYLLFTTEVAQDLFNLPGQFQTVTLQAADGVDQATLRDRVAAALPEGYEAITGEQAGAEFSDAFGQVIDIVRTVLLVFAFVTLFVAAFLINTVFNTTVGQRVRELALLRAIGARNGQVTRSVLAESFAIGLVGSIVGAVAGLGVADLIRRLFASQGGGFPDTGLVLRPSTWVIALLVGVGITMVVSLVPAIRAGRVAPVAAMRDGFSLYSNRMLVRLIFGIGTVVVGLVAFVAGLAASFDGTAARLSTLGFGALFIFLGVTALSPLFARPVANALAWPFVKLYRMTGRLAQGNAARNPRRTASTASALMIGVALVSSVGVIGTSFKNSFTEQLDQGITADYFLSSESFYGFTPEIATKLTELPDVEQVITFRVGQARIGDGSKQVAAVQEQGLDKVVNLGIVAGSAAEVPADGVVIHQDAAEDFGLEVGSPVTVQFPIGGERELRVVGIFKTGIGGLGNWIISQQAFEEGFPPDLQLDSFGGVALRPGTDVTAAGAAIAAVTSAYPEVKLEDRAEFKETQQGQINSLQVIINGLLFFSLVIAVLGIAITLALAVFERTRELGLLRAVGQLRRQTRRMVRLEAVIVAVFGAVLGIVLGLAFGIAIASALPESVVTTVAVPWGQVVGTLVIAALSGVVAALLPAWRAGRLKVLDAIAYE